MLRHVPHFILNVEVIVAVGVGEGEVEDSDFDDKAASMHPQQDGNSHHQSIQPAIAGKQRKRQFWRK